MRLLPLYLLALGAGLFNLPRTIAAPTLIYELMDQKPPVARIDESFVFNLLPSTFNSTSGNLTFTTSTLPSWLEWNSPSLVFHGTPTDQDFGETDVTLTATDSSGSVSSTFTLLVSNYSVPGIHQSFTTQIAEPSSRVFTSATAMPGGSGASVPPYWSFSLGFASDTFRLSNIEPVNGKLYSMAHQRGTVGLPSWLHFDNTSMTFNGVAPGQGSYTIVVTGTDYWGYTGTQTSFVIEVGEGTAIEMVRGTEFSNIVAMARNKVDYNIDLSNVLYDGQPVASGQVALTVDGTDFPWLSLDGTTLRGTPPDSYVNGSFSSLPVPITISSTDSSSTLTLTTWISLDISAAYFNTFSLPSMTADPGSIVSFNLSQYIVNDTATINATVNPSEAAGWLVYHQDTLTLVGTVPTDPKYDVVNVVFTANQDSFTSTAELKVTLSGVSTHEGTNGTAAIPIEGHAHQHGGGLSLGAKIAIAVAAGFFGIALFGTILIMCCYRRRETPSTPDEKSRHDADSFVAVSPGDSFRLSNGLELPRSLLGSIARFSGFHFRSESAPEKDPGLPTTVETPMTEKPTRLDGLKGMFGIGGDYKAVNSAGVVTPRLTQSTSSFMANGDVIGVTDAANNISPGKASSFTQSIGSESSRASWESRESFRWSSGETETDTSPPPLRYSRRSQTHTSIPRPRDNFTPRYPRNNSPTKLAALGASQHSLGPPPSGSSSEGRDDSYSGSFDSDSLSGSNFPGGANGVGQFGDSGFQSIEEEDEDALSVEGPAVVAMAERQSFETRQPTERQTPKLRPSKERIAVPDSKPQTERSRQAIMEMHEGMFDDAEGEVQGLGYPVSAIYTSDSNLHKTLNAKNAKERSTIKAIPRHDNPVSPPLPSVGSFVRYKSRMSLSPTSVEGRVIACANETFSIHPIIHPPPSVSLSAATWSSSPPSTYRAEDDSGGQIPAWLHFDARELELWGVPSLKHVGEVTVIRLIEKHPRDKRKSDPLAFGYEPQQEREVGRVTVEVVDRIRSPSMGQDGSMHAV